MKTDWIKAEIDEKLIIDAGYTKQIFFFQTGGGEDEDDYWILVKDNQAVRFEYMSNQWVATNWDNCNYIDGWDYAHQEVFELDKL